VYACRPADSCACANALYFAFGSIARDLLWGEAWGVKMEVPQWGIGAEP